MALAADHCLTRAAAALDSHAQCYILGHIECPFHDEFIIRGEPHLLTNLQLPDRANFFPSSGPRAPIRDRHRFPSMSKIQKEAGQRPEKRCGRAD